MYDLKRFIDAQKGSYDIALGEIKKGYKQSHWMWYIFPQIKGLGTSDISRYYEIKSIDEGKAYLTNDILKSHLIEISNALLELDNDDALKIFGFPDNLKLKSSMTLFSYIDPEITVFKKVLDKFYNGEVDKTTISILNELEETKEEMKYER